MPAALKRKRKWTVDAVPSGSQKNIVHHAPVNVVEANIEEDDHDSSANEDRDHDSAEEEEAEVNHGAEGPRGSSGLPSASEMRAINESQNLYKNNTFRFKLEALLGKIRPKQSHVSPLERTLQSLYTHLTSLPSVPPTHPLEAADTLHTLGSTKSKASDTVVIPYPLPAPSRSTAWTVAFEPPSAMNIVGSWPDELAVRKPDGTLFGVDVVVEMPSTLFQEKDYRNSRFFHKRAFYVACLAASLSQSSFNLDVHYEAIDGDVRRTCLLLTCRNDGSEQDFTKLQAAIRIIPVLPDLAPVPSRRLSPSQSNIRVGPAPMQSPGKTVHSDEVDLPTPLYNNTVALCLSRSSRMRLLGSHRLVGAAPSFREGLALLKVWANQRGFVAGAMSNIDSVNGDGTKCYCVRGFEGLGAWWACVLEVLIYGEEPVDSTRKKKNSMQLVGKGLSSYQLFRAALDFLANHDFATEPVFMKVVDHGQKYDPTEWTVHHDAVFVDASGMVNMLADVPIGSLHLLRHDARTTLKVLDQDQDPFGSVFLTDMREPHARFDSVVKIDLASVRYRNSLDFSSSQAATLSALVVTVRKALNTRARVVVPLQLRSAPRAISSPHPKPLSTLTLGIIFDPGHATRLVDHGPPASTPGVEEFRAFWGAKAELRRFKDGRILESCVWAEEVTSMLDREGVPGRIVRYILNLHFGLAEEHVHVVAGDYTCVFAEPTVRGRGSSSYKDALSSLEKFAKELKVLEDEGDIPLVLVATKACSSSLRYTSVFPPSPVPSSSTSPHPSTAYLPAFDVVLQLERSSQWPDDLRAIQKVKLALFESMARGLLRRNGDSCKAGIVLDDKASEIEDGCALEVVLDGWAFHVHISHDREATLLQDMMVTGTKQSVLPAERHTAERALQTHKRRFVHAPAHHTAILAVCHKFPSFSYTVRLVKRWLGAHWLSARISEEAVELLCLKAYISEDIPGTGKRGFVRVMEFLKSWSGVTYVPLYETAREGGETGGGQIEAGQGRWRLATLEDPTGLVWVEDVTAVVAARVRSLARATLQCFEGGLMTFKSLFRHPTADYDFIIELDPCAVSRYLHCVDASPAVWTPSGHLNLSKNRGNEPIRVRFNPPELFFRDLQVIYGDIMELFYDVHGGIHIGGVWNPSVVSPEHHVWKVFLGFSSQPTASNGTQKIKPDVTFNKDGVLAEIERMGEGLITKIILCT